MTRYLVAVCLLAALATLWYLHRPPTVYRARDPLPPEDDDGVQPDPRLLAYLDAIQETHDRAMVEGRLIDVRDTWGHPLPDDITYRILPRRSDA